VALTGVLGKAQPGSFQLGTVPAAGGGTASGTATIAGTGAVSCSATVTFAASASLAGTGALTATGASSGSGGATITAVGGLTATATMTSSGSATLTGTGSLSASGTTGGMISGAPLLFGFSDLTANPSLLIVISGLDNLYTEFFPSDGVWPSYGRALRFPGMASLTVAGSLQSPGSGGLDGVGTLTCDAKVIRAGSADLAASGLVLIEPTLTEYRSATPAGSSDLTADPITTTGRAADIEARGDMVVTCATLVRANAALAANGQVRATINRHIQADVSISGQGVAFADARVISTLVRGQGVLTVAATLTLMRFVDLPARGLLSVIHNDLNPAVTVTVFRRPAGAAATSSLSFEDEAATAIVDFSPTVPHVGITPEDAHGLVMSTTILKATTSGDGYDVWPATVDRVRALTT
jgi:hypothetical protein